jgi:ribonuclease HI
VPADAKEVVVHTDGSCRHGKGGWAAILEYGRHTLELSGGEAETTNNRMELLAAIRALEALKEPCKVTMVTDSQYLQHAFTKGWLKSWQRNGWLTAGKEPVKNRELWDRLIELTGQHEVRWSWQRGHVGHPLNERADRLANAARDAVRS